MRIVSLLLGLGMAVGCSQPTQSDLRFVDDELVGIEVSPSSATLEPTETQKFMARGITSAGGSVPTTVVWSATGGSIDDDGTYIADDEGDFRVTATHSVRTWLSDTALVLVALGIQSVASVEVSPSTAQVAAGQGVQLIATPRDSEENALTGRLVTWASDNAAIASVSGDGMVTGNAEGEATITATSEGQEGTATITVTPALVPDANEPIYDPDVHTSHFYDDFESFANTSDLMTWESHFPDRWTFENSGPDGVLGSETGNKFFRAPYSPGSNNILIESGFRAGSYFSSGERMIVTWRFRPQANYPWAIPGGANKIFLFFNTRLDFIIGTEPQVPSLFPRYGTPSLVHFTCNTEGNNWQQNMNFAMNPASISDGEWHRVTWAVTFSSTNGRGRIEMWIDGIPVMRYHGDDPSRPEYGRVDLPSPGQLSAFHFPANRNFGTPPGTYPLDFDDVRIWKEE